MPLPYPAYGTSLFQYPMSSIVSSPIVNLYQPVVTMYGLPQRTSREYQIPVENQPSISMGERVVNRAKENLKIEPLSFSLSTQYLTKL